MQVEWVDSCHAGARFYVFAFDASLFGRVTRRPPLEGVRLCRNSSITALGLPRDDPGHVLVGYAADVSSSAAHSAVRTFLKAFRLNPALVKCPEALDVVHLQKWGLLDARERAIRATEEAEATEAATTRAAEAEAMEVQRRFVKERATEVCEAADELATALATLALWRPEAVVAVNAAAKTVDALERSLKATAVAWLFGAVQSLLAYRKPRMPLERRCEYVDLVAPEAADVVEFAWHFRALAEFNGGCTLGRNFKTTVLTAYRLSRDAFDLADVPPETRLALHDLCFGGTGTSCVACGALTSEGDTVCSEECAAELCGRCRGRLATRCVLGTLDVQLVPANYARNVEILNLEYELALAEADEERCGGCDAPPGCCRLEVLGDCCTTCFRWHRHARHAAGVRADMVRRRWVRADALARLRLLKAQPDAPVPSVEQRYCRRCEGSAAAEPPDKRPRVAPRAECAGRPRSGGS
jgi:hypothetical protein